MAKFIHDNFMVHSEFGRRLYHDYAKSMPIFDYHCHLPPEQIAGDINFSNITDAWLRGDHYKWRALRANGVEERLVTGDAPDKEKFLVWAKTVPQTIGNPLYHWTHLELRDPFGIDDLVLDESTAETVWEETNRLLATPEYSTRSIMQRMNVRFTCTTDDPLDDLAHHDTLAADQDFPVTVLPAFRPDKGIHIEQPEVFREWLGRLEGVVGRPLASFEDFLAALGERLDYFHQKGARISDHALLVPVCTPATASELQSIYAKVRDGGSASETQVAAFQTQVLRFLGAEYSRRGWVMQFHISAQRNNNTRLYNQVGPDAGFDSIGDLPIAGPLNALLDSIDQYGGLPKTILYSLNAGHNDILTTTIGNFQDGSVPGKMQHGSGWWFHDQADGMLKQMTTLANMGLLSRFVGMLTDSRSFLSYPRHDYFRRLLCEMIGGWVERGEAPNDIQLLGSMVQDICWNNARDYFDVELKEG